LLLLKKKKKDGQAEEHQHEGAVEHPHLGTSVRCEVGWRFEEAGMSAHRPPMCSGSEEGSYLRPIDFCVSQLQA